MIHTLEPMRGTLPNTGQPCIPHSEYRDTAFPASRVVLYKFGHIDIVCTRASNVGTSKSTHTDALLHARFLSD